MKMMNDQDQQLYRVESLRLFQGKPIRHVKFLYTLCGTEEYVRNLVRIDAEVVSIIHYVKNASIEPNALVAGAQ